jgi:hypothetical protein
MAKGSMSQSVIELVGGLALLLAGCAWWRLRKTILKDSPYPLQTAPRRARWALTVLMFLPGTFLVIQGLVDLLFADPTVAPLWVAIPVIVVFAVVSLVSIGLIRQAAKVS